MTALATHLRPQAYTALYLAGLRLDAAAAEFQRICSQQSRIADPMSDAEEITFGTRRIRLSRRPRRIPPPARRDDGAGC
jgi:hypothetical protein